MAQTRYYYHEHLADYEEMKSRGLESRGELYGDRSFKDFSSRPFLEAVLPALSLPPDVHALELGCGTGPGACFLAERGYRVHAIDLIPDAIEKATEIADRLGHQINYDVLDVCDLPAAGDPYDLIVDSFCSQGIVKDEDRSRMFSAIKCRLSGRGYVLLSCCVLEPDRLNTDERIVDQESGAAYARFDSGDLFEMETEICYCRWKDREGLPNVGPEDYDGTININGHWYIHRRRYRTADSLRSELADHGLRVIHQSGDVLENAVCVHEASPHPRSI